MNEQPVFFVRNGIPSKWRNMPRTCLHGCLGSNLFVFLLATCLSFSSENNSIFNSKKPFSDKLLYFNRILLFAFDYFYIKCVI